MTAGDDDVTVGEREPTVRGNELGDRGENTRETAPSASPLGEDAFSRWLAEVWDEEIEPVYARRFWEPLLSTLELPDRGQVLVAGCSTGAIIPALFERLAVVGKGRVIALEERGTLLAKARARVAELDRRRVFLKGESLGRLRFADDVFTSIISNLSWLEIHDSDLALDEFNRVLAPGGQVALSAPLEGSLEEVYDLFAEVALKFDLTELQRALEAEIAHRHPSEAQARRLLESAGFREVLVQAQEHTLSFSSGRAFFESILVKALFEPRWRNLAGESAKTLFRHTREAIDTYFVGEPLSVRLVVGCINGRKPS